MTTLSNRPNRALMVIDVQRDVVAEAWNRDEVVKNINGIVTKARASNIPVIWVQHSDDYMTIGSDPWQIVPELKPLENETIIQKKFRSSFDNTNLEEELLKLEVGELYICGAETNNCVRFTTHSALERGYDITLISDAHTTNDLKWDGVDIAASKIVEEQNLSFQYYSLPERKASAVTMESVVF